MDSSNVHTNNSNYTDVLSKHYYFYTRTSLLTYFKTKYTIHGATTRLVISTSYSPAVRRLSGALYKLIEGICSLYTEAITKALF